MITVVYSQAVEIIMRNLRPHLSQQMTVATNDNETNSIAVIV